MTLWQSIATIAGLGLVTLLTRGFFMLPERDIPLPAWLQRGLKVAPLAALAAIITPEVLLSHGQLINHWQDARWPAVLVALLWFWWRPGVLGPLLVGLAVFLPLRLVLGW